jgi:hypothetical protein
MALDEVYLQIGLWAVDVGESIRLVASYCFNGNGRIELLDPVTGAVLDSEWTTFSEHWFTPTERLRTFTVDGVPHVVYVWGRGGGYVVERVGLDTFTHLIHSDDDHVWGAAVPAVVGGEPVVAVRQGESVWLRHFHGGHRIGPVWTAPAGWSCDGLVAVRDGVRVWLNVDGPRWQQRLWDPVADRLAARPITVRGYQYGPWTIGDRPALLFKVDWRDWQLWDPARAEPFGPGLGDLAMDIVQPGVLHGRPVLLGVLDGAVVIFDIGTGRRLPGPAPPGRPLAVTAHRDTVWAVDADGGLARMHVPVRALHPSAAHFSRVRGIQP